MKKILSIDGGGIRGIIPGMILVTLEEKISSRLGRPVKIGEFFDFVAGTSTGGILTCLYLCPSEEDPGKAKYSAQEAVDLYVKLGGEIFTVSFWKKMIAANGNLDEKYPADNLEKYLKQYLGDTRISQLIKPCLIPSYNIEKRESNFFGQQDFRTKGPAADFLVRDVCRATSAAPTYFETALIKSIAGEAYPLVDGGVFANNPALCAYSEVRNAVDEPVARDMIIFSLGTGSENKSYPYSKAKNWGAVGWIKPVIDIMMAGAAEVTDYHLKKMFSAHGNIDNYIRLQPSSLGNADPEMDNASEENIQALIEVGKETARNCGKELDRMADLLVKDNDKVEFHSAILA